MRIEPSETSGIRIALVGTSLLLVTFTIACIHLGDINILPVPNLMDAFGSALSPLIEAGIRVLYLGLMGLIATKVTAKGLTLLLQARLTKTNSTPV